MRVGAMTHVGQVRMVNQDGYLAQESILAVADGMGGHKAGEVASSLALGVIATWPFDWQHPQESLHQAMSQANAEILARAEGNTELKGMGTTLSMALLLDGRAYIAHIGDSRIYKSDGYQLQRLTEDHSVVAELVRSGALSETEAQVHPHRNVLTRALGTAPEVSFDMGEEVLQAGDILIFCTDGLYSLITDQEMAEVVSTSVEPQAIAERLVAMANERGGYDNITALVAAIGN
ncbi:MAG: Stp1/IreP family PP2C-type Ser/Thr phosphatase [Firmicutes bacterium]|nr:Stp1/IreP family PP2C-type Ser/Thr phosphatase [Bacillota bacterium]